MKFNTTHYKEYICEGKNMQKQLCQNKKALSTLTLIMLLLISAIIGGLISYLWVMGYYVSLKEKIPEENIATITNLAFFPENATAFDVTVLNPSFSPDNIIQVERIAISEETLGAEGKLNYVTTSVPKLPFNISRGDSKAFTCISDWSQYVNKTVIVSVFVKNGAGSTSAIRLPYTKLLVENVDFNPILGIKNFTITLRNAPLSATSLSVSEAWLSDRNLVNFTIPSLPYPLAPNETVTLTCNYDWTSYAAAGGAQTIYIKTVQGYSEMYGVQIPRLAFFVQEINFDPADTTHFDVTVKNQVSTNTHLNVSKIELLLVENGTIIDVTPALNASTNGVPGNLTATFTCAWNWTNYRNKNVIVTVYMLQGIKESGQQITKKAALLSIPDEPVFPDTQHFFVTVKNSQYSIKTANVTKITVTFEENATEKEIPIIHPPSGPYLINIGSVTMFSCYLDWENYLNKTISINIYTDEGFATFRVAKTPVDASSYRIFLTMPSAPNFDPANTTRFDAEVHNSELSDRNATITRITILLGNGTEINATCTSHALPWTLEINSTITFTCEWDWTAYKDKTVIIRIYTDEGLKTFYITKTPPP